jgi:hypothetical protein
MRKVKETIMPKALTMEEKKVKSVAATTKPERVRRNLFNGTEGKLKIGHAIDGYHLHIFNDSPGRIDTALQSGYEFVTPDEVGGTGTNVVSSNTDVGDKVRFLVGLAEDGGPMYGYLMKIKQEWYDEDQAERIGRTQQIDSALRKGKAPGVNTEGFYVPREGIKMS